MRNVFALSSVFLLVFLSPFTGCRQSESKVKAGPEAALSTFELEPGFKIELVAAEPLLGDPVDMEIDEYGRLYVVEMFGYPLDKSGTGKISLLSDTDGDGRMDKSSVFADGMVLPNSIMRWKKGVIVTDAPNLLYFEDADGDGKAEIRDTLLTGFALSNPQHNLNSPVLGIDNWIYLAHEGAVGTERYKNEFGDPGHAIFYPDQPKAPRLAINAGGRTIRFRPGSHGLEETSSATQFGHTFDAWGHHLLVNNSNHAFMEVIAERYLLRNPDLLISDATQNISDHGTSAEVFPITLNPENQLLTDVGVMTSACGITDYLGGAFPPPFDNVTFVAEPVSNIVHVDQLKDHGATFIASRIRPHQEFLASTDAKFRPVNFYVGPDGALYVVDFYRQIIEHPEWMSEDVIQGGALYNDSDKGRIYRITPADSKLSASSWTKGLALGDATNEQLVENLANPNSWYRQNAQRLLVDRADKKAVAPLLQMAKNTTAPLGRLHALWTLEGIGELKPEQILQALKDPVAGIRENAIKLAELYRKDRSVTKALLLLQDDPDPKVRFQLLCTLGFIDSPEAMQVRHKLLFKDVDDKWVQVAALSAPSSQTASLLKVVLDNYRDDNAAYSSLLERSTTMVGVSGKQPMIQQLIQKATDATEKRSNLQASILEGLAQGMESNATRSSVADADQNRLIKTFFEHPSGQVRNACFHLLQRVGIKNDIQARKAIEKALVIAVDERQPEDKRAEAIDFISLRNPASNAALLMKLVVPTEQLPVQLASLRTLSLVPDTTVSRYLLNQWPVLTPDLRDAAMKTFLVNADRVAMFLNEIETGKIQPAELSFHRKVGLMLESNDKLRNQARRLFTKNNDDEANKAYQQALKLQGDAVKGQVVYQQQCALCHQIRGKEGIALGPDLGTIHNWSPQAIMANILAPNLSISSGYDLWLIELKNGESIQGIIASETPGAITLHNNGSAEKTIKREDIKSLKAMNMSAMPSGLDKLISINDMADLLSFLKKNK